MTDKLLEKCKKHLQKGKADKFYEYIKENGLEQEFIRQVFYSTYHAYIPEEKYEENLNVSNFALRILKEQLVDKYGDKLANKMVGLIYKKNHLMTRNNSIYSLMSKDMEPVSEEQRVYIEKVLDFASDENQVVGTHIIGKDIGDILMKDGIVLTGHKFAAKDFSQEKYKEDLKGVLSKNITFFHDPIGLLSQLSSARGYNNPRGEFNDIMLVSIPKEEMEQNEEEIIIQKNDSMYLNPKYIKGYARMNVENGDIENFFENPNYIAQKEQITDVHQMKENEWEEKFKQWYEESRTTKLQKVKNKIVGFFRNLLKKDKLQEKTEVEKEER